MMIIEDGTPCGSCVNDPEDCSNIECTTCLPDFTHVENGECCGACEKT
jgi:hypothetical protein